MNEAYVARFQTVFAWSDVNRVFYICTGCCTASPNLQLPRLSHREEFSNLRLLAVARWQGGPVGFGPPARVLEGALNYFSKDIRCSPTRQITMNMCPFATYKVAFTFSCIDAPKCILLYFLSVPYIAGATMASAPCSCYNLVACSFSSFKRERTILYCARSGD